MMVNKIEITQVFFPRKVKIPKYEFDKVGKQRPAWIYFKNPLNKAKYITVKNSSTKWRNAYFAYLSKNLYLPRDYNSEEMSRYYDKLSEIYEIGIGDNNPKAIAFTLDHIKRLNPDKKGSVLEIGSGTGLGAESLVKEGFRDITLLDFSKGMLAKANKKPLLKKSKFVLTDFKKFKSIKKYDLIVSFFSLGESTYYTPEELTEALTKVKNMLNPNGIIAVHGHIDLDMFSQFFKPKFKGQFLMNSKKKFYTHYFIGRK